MKKVKTFKVGDKVFAKVKGYPAWPAVIIEDQKTKFNVRFYGTGETGIVKPKDLFYYLKHKNTFVKSLKRKDYKEAIEEIEAAIEECDGSDGNTEDDGVDLSISSSASVNDSSDSSKSNKRKRSVSSDKLNDPHMKKKSATTTDPTDSVPSNVQDEKVAEERTTARNQNENSRTDADQSPRKTKPKTSITENERQQILTSDSTSNNESLLESADLTEEEDINKYENITNTDTANDTTVMTENRRPLSYADIKIVTDDYLRALITYAEHVKKNEEDYKKRPVEIRIGYENEVAIAKLPSGKFIGIKYNRDRPSSVMSNEYDRAKYDEGEAKTVLALKSLLEEGNCNPEEDLNLFEMNIIIDEVMMRRIVEGELIERKKAKLRWLKIESSLIELDAKIKGCLGLDKAEPKIALECLNLMLGLDIDPLMLKKHPHVVDMIKRLRRYIGNVKEWNLTEDQHEKFLIDAEDVRDKAEDVYSKFAQLYNVSPESLFWDIFTEEVEEFKQQVKDMQESQVFALSSEPNSRQAFLDSIDEEEEMKIIVSKMERSNKQEKENSSKAANSDGSAEVVVEIPTSDS